MKSCMRILLTAYDCAVFYIGLLWFGLICLTWSAFAVILYPVLPRAVGQRIGRLGIMGGFHLFLASLRLSGRFHFDIDTLDALRAEESLIIAPNHPSLWDVVMIVSRLPNVACIMKAQIINNLFLGAGARLARYIRNDSLRRMIMLAVKEVQHGSQLLLFPEGTRTTRPPIGVLTGSIGAIAHRARVPVQTVIIETDSRFLAKGWPVYKRPRLPMTYRIRLGKRFDPPGNSSIFMAELEQYFARELGAGEPAPVAAPQPETAAVE
ncbi:MAG TPA: lysophospholipid acyltransferase family protein [Paucimonas sp.]|nr:lysophospholipid acyltransferase family protein [Paucimonas sp.]HJW54898.1 lysophospholipid acyltransferase family protein [Burkholderiaceae bacterium]